MYIRDIKEMTYVALQMVNAIGIQKSVLEVKVTKQYKSFKG